MLLSIAKVVFPHITWRIKEENPCLYLTFDDGPVPEATPFVLDTLQHYNAKATFFCVGENVKKHPAIYRRILEEGHSVGNHTYFHSNGWKTKNQTYISDVGSADALIHSKLFRPPYGKLKLSQYSILKKQYSIVMWDVLSKDYDKTISGGECLNRVKRKSKPGSIIVFHDSIKAFERMQYALPETMKYFSGRGFAFKRILL